MKRITREADGLWLGKWLDAVRDGSATMSQRNLSSVEAHGGIAAAEAEARKRGVHLLELTDGKDRKLIAASRHPFTTIC